MAAPALGAKAWMGWGRETVWGTPVTRTKFYEIAAGESLALDQTYFESPALGGAAIKGVYQGTKKVAGAVPCPFQYEGLEMILKDLIGSVSTGASGAGYKHTFTPADTLPVGLTVELHRDLPTAKSFLHAGCKVTKGVFSIEKNKVLMFTPSFVGGDQTLVTKSAAPTTPTAPMVLHSQLVLTKTVFAGTIEVQGATIEINNPQSEDRFDLAVGGAFKEPQRSAKRTVIVNIDAEASEEAQYTDWTAGTSGTLIWTWTGPIYTGAEHYLLVMTMNGIFTSRKPQVSDAGPVKLPGVFQCYQSGVVPDIKIELTNQVVSVG